MNTSRRISLVIGVLQVHERLHWPIRQLLMQYTNAGFMIARAGMTIEEKWNSLEVQRRDLLTALCALADQEQVAIPEYMRGGLKGVADAPR